jgi:hypothetical protein
VVGSDYRAPAAPVTGDSAPGSTFTIGSTFTSTYVSVEPGRTYIINWRVDVYSMNPYVPAGVSVVLTVGAVETPAGGGTTNQSDDPEGKWLSGTMSVYIPLTEDILHIDSKLVSGTGVETGSGMILSLVCVA